MQGGFSRALFAAAAAGALALALTLFSLGGASADGPSVSVGSVSTHIEAIAKVEISVSEVGPPGVAAWTVDLSYDPEVLTVMGCTPQQPGSICNPDYDVGALRVVGTNIYGLESGGVLASVGLACKKPGESALELKLSTFVDATPGDPTPIDAKTKHGGALCSEKPEPTATEPKPTATPPASEPKIAGDANCDGEVTSLDAALVLQYDAGLISSLPCEDADFNHDGRISSLDAALILQKVAGLL